jgi:putative hydrolase of the HAD superfamily
MNPSSTFPPVRAFLFDIGNVLLKFDFSLALNALADRSEVHDPVAALALIDQVKAAYEDGQFDRATFLRAVFDVIAYRGTEAEFVSAWEDIFEPNEPMLALVEQLHERYPLFLLSNTNDLHVDYIFRRYPAFRHFSGGTYSYAVHASKPDRAIYEIACRDLGLEPAATFFIDDLLPNIETARMLGFQTHHYHFQRHNELLTALANAGVTTSMPR